jgi:hypothetical protein
MKHCTLSAVLFITVYSWSVTGVSAAPKTEQTGQKQQKGQTKQPLKTAEKTLTGCIDEQEGQYVLINERTRDPIADLVADGFPTEGFAKHLGHMVSVRGIADPAGSRPAFRVRSIQPINDACGPQHLEGN